MPHKAHPMGQPGALTLAGALIALTAAGCGSGSAATTPTTISRTPYQRAEVARREREQRARHATAAIPAGLSAAAQRARVRRALEASVLADARRRTRAGELHGPLVGASCTPTREDRALARMGAGVVRFDCLAISSRSTTTPPMESGTPFLARVDYTTHSYAWCRFTPVGGEGTYTIKTFVPPPAACAGR